MHGAGQSLQTKVQSKVNRLWENTGNHLMPMQNSAGDAAFVLLAPRETLVGSKRSTESHQPSGAITDAGKGALIKDVTAAAFPVAVPSLRWLCRRLPALRGHLGHGSGPEHPTSPLPPSL